MAKLNKQVYITTKGEKKINCYKLTLSKKIIKQAGINADKELLIEVKDKKIIVSQK